MKDEKKIIEYELLRKEITYNDQICRIILGLLLTLSIAAANIIEFDNSDESTVQIVYVTLALQAIWIAGGLYFNEKRLVIYKIALYLRNYHEISSPEPGWETWLCKKGKQIDKENHRIPPFYIESFLTLVVTLSCTIILWHYPDRHYSNPWFWVSMVVSLVYFILMCFYILHYTQRHKRYN